MNVSRFNNVVEGFNFAKAEIESYFEAQKTAEAKIQERIVARAFAALNLLPPVFEEDVVEEEVVTVSPAVQAAIDNIVGPILESAVADAEAVQAAGHPAQAEAIVIDGVGVALRALFDAQRAELHASNPALADLVDRVCGRSTKEPKDPAE